MNTIKCHGTAKEVGKQRAIQMKSLGVYKPELYRQGLTTNRIAYAKECVSIYETYDPSLLKELHALCDELNCDQDEVYGFLLGMYACSADVFCSCFAYVEDGQAYLGRNSDFMKLIKPYCLQEWIHIEGQYRYMGHSTAFIELEDGMNEHGFCIGLTFVRPKVVKPGFNAGLLVRYLLGHCKSVKEALSIIQTVPIGSSQTLTMADANGHIAVVECNCESIEVITSSHAVYATNAFHSDAMSMYRLEETVDDLRSEQRWMTLTTAFQKQQINVTYAREVLQGKHGFLCQYPDWIPADTVWSTLYLPNEKELYFTDGNPKNTPYVMKQM